MNTFQSRDEEYEALAEVLEAFEEWKEAIEAIMPAEARIPLDPALSWSPSKISMDRVDVAEKRLAEAKLRVARIVAEIRGGLRG